MSYTIGLQSKQKNGDIGNEQLALLDQVSEIKEVSKSGDRVVSFYAKAKGPAPKWVDEEGGLYYEFIDAPNYEEEDGNGIYQRYETRIAAGGNDEDVHYAMHLTRVLAQGLDWDIVDLMSSDEPISWEEFASVVGEFKPSEKYLTHSALPSQKIYTCPASTTYFVQYLIYAINPSTQQYELLLQEGDRTYCSKVDKGEDQKDVIERDIPLLVGSTEYELVYTGDGGGAQDKSGAWLPRFDLTIYVPYFDPATRQLLRPGFWKTVES